MKRKLVAVCILTLFSAEMFGQAVITKAAEISLNQNSAIASSTPSPTGTPSTTGTPVSTGTVASNSNQDNLKDVGSYKNENFEYNVKKDDTHKYIELSYYIGSNHSVIIPDKIDGIPVEVLKSGLFAFNKIDVYDVTIPESVKLIQYRTFEGTINKDKNIYYGSSALRNVKILGKDTKIEDNAFYNCAHLRNLEADKNVFDNVDCNMFVLNHLFNGDITPFENSNTHNGLFIIKDKLVFDRYYNDCDNPKYYTDDYLYTNVNIYTYRKNRIIPEGIKTIGKCAFNGASYGNIVIPNSVEKIEKDAFKDAEIKSIYIPNKDVVIEEGAFDPSVKIYVGDNKPSDFNSLLYSYTDNGELTGYYGSDKVVEIPASINGIKITSIGGNFEWEYVWRGGFFNDNSTFNSSNNVEKVIIPEGVTDIDDYAFFNCYSLKEVVIPSTVSHISKNAFCGCTQLFKITKLGSNIDTDCEDYKDIVEGKSINKYSYGNYNGFIYHQNRYHNDVGIEDYIGDDKKIIIPNEINGLRVAYVDGINNNDIEEVIIPKDISIYNGFCNCNLLSKVSMEENVCIDKAFDNTPYLCDIYKNNNGVFVLNNRVISIDNNEDIIKVPKNVERLSSNMFKVGFCCRELDLTSSTNVIISTDENNDTFEDKTCKTIDDYKEFARQIQKQNDYYFTLKLDGNVIWSNEEGVGTDTPDNKNRPERFEITKTADSKNAIVLVVVLSSSLVIAFKLKNKIKL